MRWAWLQLLLLLWLFNKVKGQRSTFMTGDRYGIPDRQCHDTYYGVVTYSPKAWNAEMFKEEEEESTHTPSLWKYILLRKKQHRRCDATRARIGSDNSDCCSPWSLSFLFVSKWKSQLHPIRSRNRSKNSLKRIEPEIWARNRSLNHCCCLSANSPP